MSNNKILSACIDFYAKPKNNKLLFCNNGIFQLSFVVLAKPVYYMNEIKEYNPNTKQFDFYSSYGSPFAADVVNDIQNTLQINN